MVKQPSLVSDLQSIVGTEHAHAPKDERWFAVDSLNPDAVVEPDSYEQVASVMSFANERGLAVIPRGGGVYLPIGNLPRRYSVALSLSRLRKIIEHEPADLTVTCQAGISVEQINKPLRKSGQMTPFGPYSHDWRTFGGSIAANQSDLRLAYGGPRDFTVGMKVVTAEGRITKAGGKVVKNVAGYDLCKLSVGSRGSIGVIVEATLKLVPLPQRRESIELGLASIAEACNFASTIHARGLSIWSLTLRRLPQQEAAAGDSLILGVDLAGTMAGVERSLREIDQLARDEVVAPHARSPQQTGDDNVPFWGMKNDPLRCEASVIPSILPHLIEAVDSEAPGAYVSASPIEGRVTLIWPNERRDDAALVGRVRSAVSAMNGTLVVTHCDPEVKRQIDVFGDPPPSFELMRRIKQQFDPNGILSPGRFVGRL